MTREEYLEKYCERELHMRKLHSAPLSRFVLTRPAMNAASNAGATTLGELTRVEESALLRQRHIGVGVVAELRWLLQWCGLDLKGAAGNGK